MRGGKGGGWGVRGDEGRAAWASVLPPRVAQWLIRRVENREVPGSRPARVRGSPGGALVMRPSTPWLIESIGRGNPKPLDSDGRRLNSQAFRPPEGIAHRWACTCPSPGSPTETNSLPPLRGGLRRTMRHTPGKPPSSPSPCAVEKPPSSPSPCAIEKPPSSPSPCAVECSRRAPAASSRARPENGRPLFRVAARAPGPQRPRVSRSRGCRRAPVRHRMPLLRAGGPGAGPGRRRLDSEPESRHMVDRRPERRIAADRIARARLRRDQSGAGSNPVIS